MKSWQPDKLIKYPGLLLYSLNNQVGSALTELHRHEFVHGDLETTFCSPLLACG